MNGLHGGYDLNQWGPWKSHSLLLKSSIEQLKLSQGTVKRLSGIFRSVASAKNGQMNLNDFLKLFPEDKVALYHPMFVLFDRNQDGFLNEADFLAGLIATSPSTPHTYDQPSGELRLQFLFLFYDADRDGIFNAAELQRLMDHLKQLRQPLRYEDPDFLIAKFNYCFGYRAFVECCKDGSLSGTQLLLRFNQDFFRDVKDVENTDPGGNQMDHQRSTVKQIMTPPSSNRRVAEDHSKQPRFTSFAEQQRPSFLSHLEQMRSSSVSGSPMISATHTRASVMDHENGFQFMGARESLDVKPHMSRIVEDLAVKPNLADESDLHLPLTVVRKLMEFSLKQPVDWTNLDLVTDQEMEELTNSVCRILAEENTLVHVPLPCRVYGDIHGHLPDLVQFFNSYSWPDRRRGDILSMNYVFLGDFVDRGAFSVEVCALLFSLKILYPTKVFLVRGNHEDRAMNGLFGFRQACHMQFGETSGQSIWESVNHAFDHLPLAALVDKKVLCIHGGLGQAVEKLSDLENLKKPIIIPSEIEDMDQLTKADRVILDALWSDPTDNDRILGVHHSPRGQGAVKFGPDRVEDFCRINRIQLIIRAHECVQAGYEYFAGGKLLTVFSATSYCNQYANDAAMIVLTASNKTSGAIEEHPQVIKAGHPDTRIGWSDGQFRAPSPMRGRK
jgi:diadenosine tetraphosphatase ApaH/serine/threonine PP2A family protein phosphatase/Ca2+-binding EF-hand superfamily protein